VITNEFVDVYRDEKNLRLIAASDYKVVFHALLNHTQLWHCAHSHPSHFLGLGSWNEKNLGVAPSHAGNGNRRWKCHELL